MMNQCDAKALVDPSKPSLYLLRLAGFCCGQMCSSGTMYPGVRSAAGMPQLGRASGWPAQFTGQGVWYKSLLLRVSVYHMKAFKWGYVQIQVASTEHVRNERWMPLTL
eukprot:1161956-Pelagomonas_calceolata.AAC.21